MLLLGKSGDDIAIPALIKLAQRIPSAGVWRIIQRDSLLTAPAQRRVRQEQILDFLQYNAVVALSFIGNPISAQVVRPLYEKELDPSIRCQYALGLACFGDDLGIEFLVAETGKADLASSLAAAQSLYYITGQDFGYCATSSVALRRKLAREYHDWWKQIRPSFRLDPKAVIRRRLDSIPTPRIEPTSIRNLVAMASNYADVTNKYGSRSAANRLDKMGKDLIEGLEPILYDEMENLVVRREAMRRYIRLRRDKAKKAMKKLTKDENRMIAAYARKSLEAIENGSISIDDSEFKTAEITGGMLAPEY